MGKQAADTPAIKLYQAVRHLQTYGPVTRVICSAEFTVRYTCLRIHLYLYTSSMHTCMQLLLNTAEKASMCLPAVTCRSS